ncbi:hypothetical protein [Halovivax gelatinilyticus]|uniref:hypothetical protein n=1 Tax=Halovivax gelatinilyticus TaxID=2961597 RepID=UPI0020CA8C0C|nr:hypothetical protein [Halovivax gelatinilyticus]
MRRIYESEAVERDDTPFTPGERARSAKPEAFRSIPGGSVSRWFLPDWIRYRALSIDIETAKETYAVGERIRFAVTIRNAMPFPVTIPTVTPLLWTWHVDGHEAAATFDREEPITESRAFTFDRGERKRFVRRWDQRYQVAASEWEPAGPGTYTIGASLNVESPERWGLTADTTVEVRNP